MLRAIHGRGTRCRCRDARSPRVAPHLSRTTPKEDQHDDSDRLPYVEGELNYLGATSERPRYYAYDRADTDPPSHMPLEPHKMPIHDLRPVAGELSLDVQGFALAEHRSAVRDFWDNDEVRRVYYPEAEAFLKQVTGASRVFIFDHLQRRRVPGVRTARAAARASRRPACMSITLRAPARSGCATCCRTRPRNC